MHPHPETIINVRTTERKYNKIVQKQAKFAYAAAYEIVEGQEWRRKWTQ